MSVIKADGVRPFKKIRLSVGTKYFDCENFYLNSIETAAIKLIFYCTEPVTTGGVQLKAFLLLWYKMVLQLIILNIVRIYLKPVLIIAPRSH